VVESTQSEKITLTNPQLYPHVLVFYIFLFVRVCFDKIAYFRRYLDLNQDSWNSKKTFFQFSSNTPKCSSQLFARTITKEKVKNTFPQMSPLKLCCSQDMIYKQHLE